MDSVSKVSTARPAAPRGVDRMKATSSCSSYRRCIKFVAQALLQRYRCCWIALPKLPHAARHQRVQRPGRWNADAQAAQLAPSGTLHGVQCPRVLIKQRASMGQQHPSCVCELDAAGLAPEQLHSEALFERLDAQAEGRLLRVQPLRRPRDMAFLRDGDKRSEVVPVELIHQSRYEFRSSQCMA